jgi:hypothetical protein
MQQYINSQHRPSMISHQAKLTLHPIATQAIPHHQTYLEAAAALNQGIDNREKAILETTTSDNLQALI